MGEERLVRRLQSGDSSALEAIYDLHVNSVLRYAQHLLGDRDDAEEVAVDTFVRAFRSAVEFRGGSQIRTWLFSIARNLCRDRLRQPRLMLVDFEVAQKVAVVEKARHDDVKQVFGQLPPEVREALYLCDVEEWTAREAAGMAGITEEAMKSRLYRARRALRDGLRELWQREEADGLH